jgi:hypothetical protein
MINPYAPPDESRQAPAPEPWEGRVDGTFKSPLIGVARVPSGLTGDGWITATRDGLMVEARRTSRGSVSCFGLLGLLVGFIGVFFTAMLKVPALGWFLVIGGAFGGAAFGRWLGGRKPYRAVIPWHAVTEVALWGPKLEFVSRAEPAGTVEFNARPEAVEGLQRAVFHALPPQVQARIQATFRQLG